MVERTRARLSVDTPAGSAPASAAHAAGIDPPPSRRPRRLGGRTRRLWLGASAAAAALAAALLVLLWPAPAREPLPAYTARLAGGTQEWRAGEPEPEGGEAGGRANLAPGNALEIVLRPGESVAGRLAAETFLFRGGRLEPWPVPLQVSEHGAVRIAGRVGEEIPLPSGEIDLVIAIARPGSLPSARELEARLAQLAEAAGAGGAACRSFGRDALWCSLPVIVREEA
jgi:hypothetical protein